MKLSTLQGIIERRILVNFTADPATIQKILPAGFRPQIYNGKAIAGICLIRLKHVRPKGFPAFTGIASENAAHRIAVEWTKNGEIKTGVYIPRRDTSSLFNTWAGGRVFPGKHFHASFDVKEEKGSFQINIRHSAKTIVSLSAETAAQFSHQSIFSSLENASRFFENGAVGYSPNEDKLEGLELRTFNWKVTPLHVTAVQSGFFENESVFPAGTVQFDNALLMTDMLHEWRSV